ncbi:DNA-binding domain-containing protein [Rhizobium sp. P44RR-XXIV]|uniref:HvfC/BufC N-terminal domain-containing protein n=1 Tax=Rhizobium sp. P44RR-XXIV TaxID=1921145 RepID=UPI0010AACB4B|nr:DNA-binding domain-containing protein [Rhizobium sp. P44RR-XXIV]TIX92916.1 DUF2063 domain-containing protein [Rhizobium sp. P44RR-XXIV]
MSLSTQTEFAAALVDLDRAVPEGLEAWNGPRPERRFGVYRNNVAVGLIGALTSRFPAAEKIVGEEFFAAMAHEFIRLHPPHSPLLLAYGDNFGDFVGSFEPAGEIPYLPDVIRLEVARGKAYHAADAAPLDAALLATVEPEGLARLRFVPHPSASIIRSAFPIITIWAMNTGEIELADIEDWTGEDALVVRPQMTVEVHSLPAGGAVFLEELVAGADLGSAFEAALAETPDFDLSANLAGALAAGAFMAIR